MPIAFATSLSSCSLPLTLVAFDEPFMTTFFGHFLQQSCLEGGYAYFGAKNRPAANDWVLAPFRGFFLVWK